MKARLLAALVTILAVHAAPAHAAELRIVTRDGQITQLGAMKPMKDPRVRAAIRAFGEPDSKRRIGEDGVACHMRWKRLGLRLIFANFGGGATACHGVHGKLQAGDIKGRSGRRWKTAAGLRIGSRERSIPRLHPSATRHGNGWWLATMSLPYGENCPCPYPSLRAKTRSGRVSSLRMYLGRAGD